MKRPAGVILTATVLGLFAAFQLLTAVGSGFASAAMRHPIPGLVAPDAATSPPIPPLGIGTGLFAAYAIFLLLLAI